MGQERICQYLFMAKLQLPYMIIYLWLEEHLDLDITWMSIIWTSPNSIGIDSALFQRHWILFKIMRNILLPGTFLFCITHPTTLNLKIRLALHSNIFVQKFREIDKLLRYIHLFSDTVMKLWFTKTEFMCLVEALPRNVINFNSFMPLIYSIKVGNVLKLLDLFLKKENVTVVSKTIDVRMFCFISLVSYK